MSGAESTGRPARSSTAGSTLQRLGGPALFVLLWSTGCRLTTTADTPAGSPREMA